MIGGHADVISGQDCQFWLPTRPTSAANFIPLPYASANGRAQRPAFATVPLLTKERGSIYPFLKRDFTPGGVLASHEVYAFVPSSVTVIEGDTVRFCFVNPEDDVHTFVLGDLAVAPPGQSETRATWVARRAGIHDIERVGG